MECARGCSFATWRLQLFRQILASAQQPSSMRRSISSLPAQQQPNPEDETPSETDNNIVDSEKVYTPPSQRLPQSPLMTHPRFNQPKVRKKQPKDYPMSEDRAALLQNPWARALGSPARLCSITGARMPRDLMGEWGLVRQPGTEETYLLPVDLIKDSLTSHKNQEHTGSSSSSTTAASRIPSAVKEAPEQGQSDVGEPEESIIPLRQENAGKQLIFRTVNSRQYFQLLSKPLSKTGGKRPAVARLLPFRWKYPQGPITSRQEKHIVWIQDMTEYLLRQMRQNIVRKMKMLSSAYTSLTAQHGVWRPLYLREYSDAGLADVLARMRPIERMECGAVLLLGPQNLSAVTENSDALGQGDASEEPSKITSFSETVLLPHNQRRVPIFDLTKLLSESDLAKLRGLPCPHFQKPALFFRPKTNATADTMLSLWKLQRFLAEDPKLAQYLE
ncbi:uncharacterized protein N7459_000311 [Penicillium hispanicum]|uniref:uncharacterized protein n=1 Tax=Penicillium hispanicum TaxID=1080232 RepID=UPI002540494A|nr:uncharacterized protein N7459_000311 [Penicillium hispanicum]KAJ5594103.1 hypothetical protein N7459_000311 [Penicillium hispanicum]